PEINPRVLVDAVPERRLAICIFTASYRIDLSPVRPNTVPATSISPTRSRAAENSGTLTASGAFAASRFLRSAIGRLRLADAFLGRVIDDHHRAVRAGHRTRDQDRVIVGQNLEHPQIHHRGALVTQLPRHPHPLAHAARIRAITDRAAVAEILVRAVRTGKAGKVMAPDDTSVAAPLGSSRDVDPVARLEDVGGGDILTRLEFTFAAAIELA